jgi:hypothetical protein
MSIQKEQSTAVINGITSFPQLQVSLGEIIIGSNPLRAIESGPGQITGFACTNRDRNSPTPRTECLDSPCNRRERKKGPPRSEGEKCTDLCVSINICADPD